MPNESFDAVMSGLRAAAARFPNCRIANCDCDSKNGKWEPECYCMCHWSALNEEFGKDVWTLEDAVASARAGKPVRA